MDKTKYLGAAKEWINEAMPYAKVSHKEGTMIEPKIHSHIEDMLPDDHPLAFEQVSCISCDSLVHAANNECMQTWVETGVGNFCFYCFVIWVRSHEPYTAWVLDDKLGLQVPIV